MKTKTLFIFLLLFILSCDNKPTKPEHIPDSRIQMIERVMIDGYIISIVKVDSIEYLYTYRGGLVRHSK